MKMTKRQKLFLSKVQPGKSYSFEQAVAILKECATPKFNESVDLAVNLGIDAKKSDQNVRGSTVLPSGSGKTSARVAVFAQGAKAEEARAAGADVVGMEDLAEQIKGGDLNFTTVIASPDTMRIVGTLGQVLGPRGLMPNPKTGTVTADVATAVKNAKSGQAQFKNNKEGVLHCSIGVISFEAAKIQDNLVAVLRDLRRLKPTTSKGIYLRRVTLSTTMGPGIALDLSSLPE
jgi:large subunit ribosomal protein L1